MVTELLEAATAGGGSAQWGIYRNRAVDRMVGGNTAAHHHLEGIKKGGQQTVERQVDGTSHLAGRTAKVEVDLVGLFTHHHMDRNRTAQVNSIVVHKILKAIFTIGQLGQPLAHQGFGIVQQHSRQAGKWFCTVAGHHFLEATYPHRVGGQLGVEVGPSLSTGTAVEGQKMHNIGIDFTPAGQAAQRNAHG